MNGRLFGGRPWAPALAILPMFAGFAFAGVQAGMVIGFSTVGVIVYLAMRADPEAQIEVAAAGTDVPGGILVIVLAAIEEPRTASVLAVIADPSRKEAGAGLLVLAPAQASRMDRWAGDIEKARFESQRTLAVSIATLAAAGVEAEGRVGDGDLVLAVEDVLRTYAANEVVVVAAEGDLEGEIATLERRLAVPSGTWADVPVRRIICWRQGVGPRSGRLHTDQRSSHRADHKGEAEAGGREEGLAACLK